jgi:hypothetical protein
MNKTRSHLYMFKNINSTLLLNLHRPFIATESIVCIFFSFFSPVRFASAQLASFPPFPLSVAASPPANVATSPHRVTFPSHGVKTSSLLSLHLPATLRPIISHSRAETEALNPHHHHRPPFSDHLTPNLHCYKNVISTLSTLPTTQSGLYFTSSLARAPYHQSSNHRCRSLLPSSHVYRPSAQ